MEERPLPIGELVFRKSEAKGRDVFPSVTASAHNPRASCRYVRKPPPLAHL